MALGLVMAASASAPLNRPWFGAGAWSTPLGRQAVFVAVGLVVAAVSYGAARRLLDAPALFRAAVWLFFGIVVSCLAAALLPGFQDPHRGSHRWLRLGVAGLSFQPSETAKPALVLVLAAFFAGKDRAPRRFGRDFLPSAAALGIVVLLVGSQNLGTAALLAAVGGLRLVVAGCRWVHLLPVLCLGASALSFLLLAADYRIARLTAYARMWEDPRGLGYQPLQSLATIASGGWWGTGLGAGVQKYGYLPESHTDFVFSILCEETGFLGACLIIGVLVVLVWQGARVMLHAASPFERLAAFGLTATFGLQAAMNIAVVTVVTPTTGISLPLISAGGSGTITYGLIIGLLAAMASRTRAAPVRAFSASDSPGDVHLRLTPGATTC
jgi:cell division protein FtsW